jgi:hypothetical protein
VNTKKIDEISFSIKIEKMFLGKDHVGIVRHFEGINIDSFVNFIRRLMKEIGKRYEDCVEEINQKKVYNNLCYLNEKEKLYLWIKATQINIGLMIEIRIYHPTELSVLSDELLSRFVSIIDNFYYKN